MSASLSEDSWGGSGKKKSEEMDLDITPMIDVTFLLLIFFMVSSTMQATPDHEVPEAENGQRLEQASAMVLFVTGGGSKQEKPVIKQGKTNITLTLEQIATEVEKAAQGGKKNVIIRADKKIPSGFIDDIEREIVKVEGIQITIGVRDKHK